MSDRLAGHKVGPATMVPGLWATAAFHAGVLIVLVVVAAGTAAGIWSGRLLWT